jgi:hypothetical protein
LAHVQENKVARKYSLNDENSELQQGNVRNWKIRSKLFEGTRKIDFHLDRVYNIPKKP